MVYVDLYGSRTANADVEGDSIYCWHSVLKMENLCKKFYFTLHLQAPSMKQLSYYSLCKKREQCKISLQKLHFFWISWNHCDIGFAGCAGKSSSRE